MMSKSKKVLSFVDAVSQWEKVAKRPYDDEETNDEGEMSSAIISDSDTPMVHYYMDDPSSRVVVTMSKLADDQGDARFVFYPLGSQLFTVEPSGISESGGNIMIDTLDRKTDCVIRDIEKDDSVWAIGRVVETMRELLDEIGKMDD